MKKVSVIIPSHDRYDSLMAAVASAAGQTHRNIEIIVINDGSRDERYYTSAHEDIVWIDLPENSRTTFGYPCPGHVRNRGLEQASGDYVAFLDDDDLWMPGKIEAQLKAMTEKDFSFSCTEGYMGDGIMSPDRKYPVYHREHYLDFCRSHFENSGQEWTGKLPDIFDRELIARHNFIITSSVVLERRILDLVGPFQTLPAVPEDRDLWLRCLEKFDCLHLNDPYVYYDGRLSKRKGIKKPDRGVFQRFLDDLFKRS